MLGRMLLFFCFLFLFSLLQAQRIYVSEQGTGMGTSWQDAMDLVQKSGYRQGLTFLPAYMTGKRTSQYRTG